MLELKVHQLFFLAVSKLMVAELGFGSKVVLVVVVLHLVKCNCYPCLIKCCITLNLLLLSRSYLYQPSLSKCVNEIWISVFPCLLVCFLQVSNLSMNLLGFLQYELIFPWGFAKGNSFWLENWSISYCPSFSRPDLILCDAHSRKQWKLISPCYLIIVNVSPATEYV